MLAKFIRMRTARSHPRGARTRALNVPRRASTNIRNRAKGKLQTQQISFAEVGSCFLRDCVTKTFV
ncbi:MAG: hypothetical protein E7057_07820 [Lentisphaerae bacterium]|nr:hypothetical protein [Lentisphaerota bacterium]